MYQSSQSFLLTNIQNINPGIRPSKKTKILSKRFITILSDESFFCFEYKLLLDYFLS